MQTCLSAVDWLSALTRRLLDTLALSFASLMLAQPALAGGTVPFASIQPLLAQKPTLLDMLQADYVLPDAVFAEIRLGPSFKNLAGAKTGPYHFLATRSALPGSADVLVLVCTDVQFISARGRVLAEADWERAVRIRERLISVSFHTPDAQPVCTGS